MNAFRKIRSKKVLRGASCPEGSRGRPRGSKRIQKHQKQAKQHSEKRLDSYQKIEAIRYDWLFSETESKKYFLFRCSHGKKQSSAMPSTAIELLNESMNLPKPLHSYKRDVNSSVFCAVRFK